MTQYFNFEKFPSLLRAAALAFTVLVSSAGVIYASPINVNTATQTELESIKGIGPAKAKTIIAERLDGGHFQDANDLQKRVRGIGMKSVEKMVDNGLTIESPSSFREPNGRTKKEGSASSRRNARNQASPRNQQERTGASRRN
ncbi:helix-hairpin-helix domain-containing protein [Polynucleobacter ibericus]|uniref:helix-hairpin-helix domain-containing protein n=1 Tax=Polynucleobacter ibericus TaxID=1819725 RepID=UPI001BFEC38C|nr:helix-hairpin-helix domain-containing protein [Polynucleobacter ibericus]QWE08214.1 helix-hairpin-helix domain-containing protein [Polynucleobacter ibericus]